MVSAICQAALPSSLPPRQTTLSLLLLMANIVLGLARGRGEEATSEVDSTAGSFFSPSSSISMSDEFPTPPRVLLTPDQQVSPARADDMQLEAPSTPPAVELPSAALAFRPTSPVPPQLLVSPSDKVSSGGQRDAGSAFAPTLSAALHNPDPPTRVLNAAADALQTALHTDHLAKPSPQSIHMPDSHALPSGTDLGSDIGSEVSSLCSGRPSSSSARGTGVVEQSLTVGQAGVGRDLGTKVRGSAASPMQTDGAPDAGTSTQKQEAGALDSARWHAGTRLASVVRQTPRPQQHRWH